MSKLDENREYTVYFIVFEIIDNQEKQFAVVSTFADSPYKYIQERFRRFENKMFYHMYNMSFGFKQAVYNKLKISSSLKDSGICYFYFKKTIKNNENFFDIEEIILKNAINGEYENLNKNFYKSFDNRWKSEFKVFELVKSMYNNLTVKYHYRPLFYDDKLQKFTQFVYDIYIVELKIAIEYQGRQHFEPVDFFGGENKFEITKSRDEYKKKISDQYGVKVIYWPYDQNLSEEKIKNLINENKVDKCYYMTKGLNRNENSTVNKRKPK